MDRTSHLNVRLLMVPTANTQRCYEQSDRIDTSTLGSMNELSPYSDVEHSGREPHGSKETDNAAGSRNYEQ